MDRVALVPAAGARHRGANLRRHCCLVRSDSASTRLVGRVDLQNTAVDTVNSLIIENSSPIENGDFERFLAFRLARIGIFL